MYFCNFSAFIFAVLPCAVVVRASTRIIVCRLFFQICAVWAGLSLGAVWLYATLAQRDRSDGQMWKNVAHQTQTRGKMLFFPLCVKIATYQMPLSSVAFQVGMQPLPFRLLHSRLIQLFRLRRFAQRIQHLRQRQFRQNLAAFFVGIIKKHFGFL